MQLDKIFYVDFTTSDPGTGGAIDADSTPTCDVFEDNNNTPIYAPSVTKITGIDGSYRVRIETSAANGFEIEKSYNALLTATVGGVTGKQFISSFIIEANTDVMIKELYMIQGLDIANVMTVTPTTRVAGSINLALTGDGETSTTVTRQ